MDTQVPDHDGSVAVTLGITLAVIGVVLASMAPVVTLGALGCLAAGYLAASLHARSRVRTGRRHSVPGPR